MDRWGLLVQQVFEVRQPVANQSEWGLIEEPADKVIERRMDVYASFLQNKQKEQH